MEKAASTPNKSTVSPDSGSIMQLSLCLSMVFTHNFENITVTNAVYFADMMIGMPVGSKRRLSMIQEDFELDHEGFLSPLKSLKLSPIPKASPELPLAVCRKPSMLRKLSKVRKGEYQ